MPKSLPPLPLKIPQKTVVRTPSSKEDKPSYPSLEELLPLSNAPQDIIDVINALLELPEEQRTVAWQRKSKEEMFRIMKHLKIIRVPWICIEAKLMIYDDQNNVFSGNVIRQYESSMEQPWNRAYIRVTEMIGLLICGEAFGNQYQIQDFDSSFVTLKKMISLPFPVRHNDLITTLPSLENAVNVLNLKNEDSFKYWEHMTVFRQKKIIENCINFEVPWNAIISDLAMSCPCTILWNGHFNDHHASLVKDFLREHDVYADEPPRFTNMRIIVQDEKFREEHFLEGEYEITGSNDDYVSLERLPSDDDESLGLLSGSDESLGLLSGSDNESDDSYCTV